MLEIRMTAWHLPCLADLTTEDFVLSLGDGELLNLALKLDVLQLEERLG